VVSAVDLYVAAFLARCNAVRGPGQPKVDQLGVRGLLAGTEDSRIRLLVTDDRAHDVLAALLSEARVGMIRIFEAATRCAQLVASHLEWASEIVTAMVCRDLQSVPALSLPGELRLRPVQRLAHDEQGGVALEDAIAAAISAGAAVEEPPEVFADFLRSLPSTFRLFAAVDSDGTVRATSGSGVFGRHATVIFVNTEPGWRGRGIGQAMTAEALIAAQRSGARQACLDASAAGHSIYRRLGFESAGRLTRFLRPS
jgi:GNAT superfamily N-acetyltransferase